MSRKVKISGLADAVMEELNAYAKTIKKAGRKRKPPSPPMPCR